MRTIEDRYQRLLDRRAPLQDRAFQRFAESFEAQPGTNTRFLLGAMKPVDPKYTAKLTEQGDRVENQLSRRLRDAYSGIEFRRQGSVSNGTHIRYSSDVDVLVMIDEFFTLEPPLKPQNPYQGDPIDALATLRSRCVSELSKAFPQVEIDDSGSTATTLLRSGSLACDVDVVPANWFNTVAYSMSGAERDRAVQVLDREKRVRTKNSPFLFNHRLDEHDVTWGGVPRILIRLLKTVKADMEEEVPFSSFDLCSVVYRFHRGSTNSITDPLALVREGLVWMTALAANESARKGAKVVDDSREIFDKAEKANAFGRIVSDLAGIWLAANKEQQTRLLTAAHL